MRCAGLPHRDLTWRERDEPTVVLADDRGTEPVPQVIRFMNAPTVSADG